MWGETTAELYYAVSADIVACNTVKCYYDFGYSQTGDVNMTKTSYTYQGKLIYSISLTANNDGVDALYFKPKGTSDGEQLVMSGWTMLSTRNGQMYVHDEGWKSYTKDATYTIYFVNYNDWATPKAYAWNSDCDKNADYATSAPMTKTDYKYNGHDIYSITFSKGYEKVIFNNNGSGSAKTGDLECYSQKEKLYNGSDWQSFGHDITIYAIPEASAYGYETAFNVSTHNLKANVQVGDDEWLASMPLFTKTSYKYNGSWIYKVTILAKYNVIKRIQFRVENKSDNSWVEEYDCTPGTQYGADNIDGKIFGGWVNSAHTWYDYATDITLDLQGGSDGSTSVTATVGSAMPSASMPTRTGYTFGGYFTAADGGGTQYYNADGTSANNMIIDGPTTLYAKWTPNTYTITLDPNGGSDGTESVGIEYGQTAPNSDGIGNPYFVITNPIRLGYTFLGWFTTDGKELIDIYGRLLALDGYTDNTPLNIWIHLDNVTLYAHWTPAAAQLCRHSGEAGSGAVLDGSAFGAGESYEICAYVDGGNWIVEAVCRGIEVANAYLQPFTSLAGDGRQEFAMARIDNYFRVEIDPASITYKLNNLARYVVKFVAVSGTRYTDKHYFDFTADSECAPDYFDIYHYDDASSAPTGARTSFAGGAIMQPIRYFRHFDNSDWTTVCVPFNVSKVTVYDTEEERDYSLYPRFNNGSTDVEGYYWLKTFSEARPITSFESAWEQLTVSTAEVDANVLTTLVKPVKNTPYIIAFPDGGGYYATNWVVFHGAAGQTIDSEFAGQSSIALTDGYDFSQVQLQGNNTMHQSSTLTNIYTIDEGDDYFTRKTVAVPAFEAYLIGTAQVQASYAAVRYRGGQSVPTSVDNLPTTGEWQGRIYTATGICVATFADRDAMEHSLIHLPAGVYIVYTQGSVSKIVIP